MPQAAQQHRDETVDVGDDLLATLGMEVGHDAQHGSQAQEDAGHRPAAGQDGRDQREQGNPEPGSERGIAVAAQGNVEVVAQPAAQRHVPAPPEVLRVAGLVRRIEVLGQVEAHQHRHADGDVGITGEVGIHLQGIAEECAQVLEAREQERVLEHAVHEIDRDVVAQDQFLSQTVQDPEYRDAELPPAQAERLVELRDELARPHDRARDQLREEAHVEAEIQDVGHRLHVPAVHIHGIADHLEGEERDAHREHDAVHPEELRPAQHIAQHAEHVDDLQFQARQRMHEIREEIGVLEIAEQQQVDAHAQHQPGPFAARPRGGGDPPGDHKVRAGHKDQDQHRQAAGLVVEEEADEKQEGIAQQPPVADQGEEGIDHGEKRPEIELGEQQRRVRIESEQPL